MIKKFPRQNTENCIDSSVKILQRRRRWGGRGGMCPPPPPHVLGYQLTLFGPRGADYARHITTAPPPPHLFGRCGVSVLSCT